MESKPGPTFEFPNQVSPRYFEPIFLQLQYNQWYSINQMIDMLHLGGINVEGKNIASRNMLLWTRVGLGSVKRSRHGSSNINLFCISRLGKHLIDIYSTNKELFYDTIHYLFYSTFLKSKDVRSGGLWLYASVCNTLWKEAPSPVDTLSLTNRIQIEAQDMFPGFVPSFSERSVRSPFPWLQTLSPPFLSRQSSNKSQLYSNRRGFCTPQLFHLATDLIYRVIEGVQYGSSLAINEQQIEDICKVCLLDPEKFWNMASLTEMTINGYEIHQGQWGTSILLEGPPGWITLPDFSKEQTEEDENMFVDGGKE